MLQVTQRELAHRTGSEGPRHDPYAYTEYVLVLNGSEHRLHMGLGVWYEVNGVRQEFAVPAGCAPYGDEYEAACVAAWESATGMNPRQFERYYWRAHPYQHECGYGNPSRYE